MTQKLQHHETSGEGSRCVEIEKLPSILSPTERAKLATTILNDMEENSFFDLVVSLARERMAGAPLPPLLDVEDEANWWANIACVPERKVYLAACFARLPIKERKSFLDAATRRLAK